MPRPRPILAASLALLAAVAAANPGCDRSTTPYSTATPDETIDAAQAMIATGDAASLTDLIYAEDPETRAFFDQVGSMLGALQDLGTAVETRFPEELAKFRDEAEAAAEQGKSNPLFARLVAAGRGSRQNATFGVSQINREGLTLDTGQQQGKPRGPAGILSGNQSDSQREIINDIIKQLLADPYRWLEEGRDRIEPVYIADDTVALTWDERPILPPFGLTMIKRDARWYLVAPTSYPGVRMALPRNADEWFIWGSMVKTLERVVIDLTRDVRSGRVRNMTDLADSAAEKVAIPAMLVFFAYSKLMEERKAEAAAQRKAQESQQEAEQQAKKAAEEAAAKQTTDPAADEESPDEPAPKP